MPKVMVVEDDNNLREIYTDALTAEDLDVVSAADGEEALATAVKEIPDLIILDVMMPKISGFDVLDILRSTPETKDAKIIMMTALSQQSDKERGERLGADRYLIKSQVTIPDIIANVTELLASVPGADAEAPAATDTAEQPISIPGLPVNDFSSDDTTPATAQEPPAVAEPPQAAQPPADDTAAVANDDTTDAPGDNSVPVATDDATSDVAPAEDTQPEEAPASSPTSINVVDVEDEPAPAPAEEPAPVAESVTPETEPAPEVSPEPAPADESSEVAAEQEPVTVEEPPVEAHAEPVQPEAPADPEPSPEPAMTDVSADNQDEAETIPVETVPEAPESTPELIQPTEVSAPAPEEQSQPAPESNLGFTGSDIDIPYDTISAAADSLNEDDEPASLAELASDQASSSPVDEPAEEATPVEADQVPLPATPPPEIPAESTPPEMDIPSLNPTPQPDSTPVEEPDLSAAEAAVEAAISDTADTGPDSPEEFVKAAETAVPSAEATTIPVEDVDAAPAAQDPPAPTPEEQVPPAEPAPEQPVQSAEEQTPVPAEEQAPAPVAEEPVQQPIVPTTPPAPQSNETAPEEINPHDISL